MTGLWTPLAALAVTLLLLVAVKHWIARRLQELSIRWTGDSDVALVVYFVTVLPGVVIHELSHWLMALILGVKVQRLSLGPVRAGRGNRVSLGSIRVGKVDPVRASLIGLAPLLGGSAAIVLIGYLVLGLGNLPALVGAAGLWEGVREWLRQVILVGDLGLWVYLVFAISNAMLPSDSDMATIRPVLLFLAGASLVLLIATGIPSVPGRLSATANAMAGYLASAFGLTLAVDAVFVLFVLPITWITRRIQERTQV